MKKYKHKQTGDIAFYNGNNYEVEALGLYVPDRFIENSNDWELITNIEVGKVYKKDGLLILVKEKDDNSEKLSAIGFNFDNKWNELREFRLCFDTLTEATNEEQFERLKEEAIKRGLVEGVKFEPSFGYGTRKLENYLLDDEDLSLISKDHDFLMDANTGKWATPIEEKKPILTTHDGVELFEGNMIFYVTKQFEIHSNPCNKFDGTNNNYVCFSTKEKAQEYIDLHQKKYSLADLQEALNNLKNK